MSNDKEINNQATRNGFSLKKLGKRDYILLAVAALYIVSPIDLVFDVFPVVGQLDDLGVLGAIVTYILKRKRA